MPSFSLSIKRDEIMPNLIKESGGIWKGEFSFREGVGNAKIFPFSSSLSSFITSDSAFESINKDSYKNFLDIIPSIKFRAYYPNTALNEIFSLLGNMTFSGDLKSFFTDEIEKLYDKASKILRGLARPNSSKTLASEIVDGARTFDKKDDAVYNLPFALYYRLVSSTNSAVYEVPCQIPNGFFDSNGNYGWGNEKSDFDIFNVTEFFRALTSTFHLTMMPFFIPGNGGESESITVKFDLMNDTWTSAKANYQFIQTLILNNKWLQYGITQLPGSVYDVKIAGGQRFFMCTGDFKVTNKGVLRSIGEYGSDLKPYGKDTRIPDAYSLDLTFKSLLPNNLNNYLFGIAEKTKNMTVNETDMNTSVFGKVMYNMKNVLGKIGDNETAFQKALDETSKKESESYNPDKDESGMMELLGETESEREEIADKVGRNAANKVYDDALEKGKSPEEARNEAMNAFKEAYKSSLDSQSYINQTSQDQVQQYRQQLESQYSVVNDSINDENERQRLIIKEFEDSSKENSEITASKLNSERSRIGIVDVDNAPPGVSQIVGITNFRELKENKLKPSQQSMNNFKTVITPMKERSIDVVKDISVEFEEPDKQSLIIPKKQTSKSIIISS